MHKEKLETEVSHLGGRRPTDGSRWLILGLAVAWSVFQVWATWIGSLDQLFFRAAHLAFAFALVFLVYPLIAAAAVTGFLCSIGFWELPQPSRQVM